MLIRPKPSVILICSDLETYSRPPASLVTQILGGGDEPKKFELLLNHAILHHFTAILDEVIYSTSLIYLLSKTGG